MDNVPIFRVDTGEAVKSVNDLKANISALKEQLSGLEIGSKEYSDTLRQLNINQAALKNAMYATNAAGVSQDEVMQELTAAAKGQSTSYNGLVKQMADYKAQLRSLEDPLGKNIEKYRELTGKINTVNQKLKEMDEAQGNYSRSVGNYATAAKGFADVLKAVPGTVGPAKEQLSKLGDAIGLIGKQPLLAMVGLLAPVIMRITTALKGNATAMDAIKKLMDALKPAMDLVSGVVQKLAEYLSQAVDYFVDLAAGSGDTFKKIIAGAVGVGNVLVQNMLTPVRTLISAFKGLGGVISAVFTGDLAKAKEAATEAWDGIKNAFTKGFSFADNFAQGQAIGEQFIAGLGTASVRAEAHDTGVEIGKAVGEGIGDGLEEAAAEIDRKTDALFKQIDDRLSQTNKTAAGMLKNRLDGINSVVKDAEEASAKRLAIMDEYYAKAQERGDLEGMLSLERQIAAEQVKLEQAKNSKLEALYEEDARAKETAEKAKKTAISAGVGAASSMLKSMADIMESQGELTEEEANRIKGVRIAAAVIDTISGAVGAYMQAAATLPPPLGAIVGAVQAAAITAAGAAQIATMKSTSVTDGNASVGSPSVVSAPKVVTQIPQTAIVTKTSTEDAINSISQPQKVYILQSDLEAAGKASKVKVNESTF